MCRILKLAPKSSYALIPVSNPVLEVFGDADLPQTYEYSTCICMRYSHFANSNILGLKLEAPGPGLKLERVKNEYFKRSLRCEASSVRNGLGRSTLTVERLFTCASFAENIVTLESILVDRNNASKTPHGSQGYGVPYSTTIQ